MRTSIMTKMAVLAVLMAPVSALAMGNGTPGYNTDGFTPAQISAMAPAAGGRDTRPVSGLGAKDRLDQQAAYSINLTGSTGKSRPAAGLGAVSHAEAVPVPALEAPGTPAVPGAVSGDNFNN